MRNCALIHPLHVELETAQMKIMNPDLLKLSIQFLQHRIGETVILRPVGRSSIQIIDTV